uniref:prostaglandin E2 receptor EP4 subtype-like isoform X2 n=1 Tax=Myxine glutinosa TaxID=7769 RepID=UPI00358E6C2A
MAESSTLLSLSEASVFPPSSTLEVNWLLSSRPDDLFTVNQTSKPSHDPITMKSAHIAAPAVMFLVGVIGNVVALAALCATRRESKASAFYTLVFGLAFTDLLGTCLASPVVLVSHASGSWRGGQPLCDFLSFTLLFFGSTGISLLCAMAVERYLALNHAFYHDGCVTRGWGRRVLVTVWLGNLVLCVPPLFGFGQNVKHFPGTWCFVDWQARDTAGMFYSFLYAGVCSLLVLITLMCNVAVAVALLGLRRRAAQLSATVAAMHSGGETSPLPANKLSREVMKWRQQCTHRPSAEESQMLWLLFLMTVAFLICSTPLVVRIFVNQIWRPDSIKIMAANPDIQALRLACFNPILDPWVYILCRRRLLVRLIRPLIICRVSPSTPTRVTPSARIRVQRLREREVTPRWRNSEGLLPMPDIPVVACDREATYSNELPGSAEPSIYP